MPSLKLQHRRTHNLLLLAKLLDQRDAATSPFTLLCDSLEQAGRLIVREYIRKAKIAGSRIVFVSFETLRRPKGVDDFVEAWRTGDEAQNAVSSWTKTVAAAIARGDDGGSAIRKQRTLLILDTLNPLCASHPTTLPILLSSFLSPLTSLLAIYHTDIPLPPPSSPQEHYRPAPLTLLRYLATTLLTTHNLSHVLAAHAARSRSLVAPTHGLLEQREGVLQGLSVPSARASTTADEPGLVLELEHRRKSGRGVRELFFLPTRSLAPRRATRSRDDGVQLLEDYPAYRRVTTAEGAGLRAKEEEATGGVGATFSMELTERQRRDREGVVLPYFDAQQREGEMANGGGGGDGGRILYDFGSEDDFDEEEDEI